MNINDVHNIILFYLNKEQNQFVSHGEIDLCLDRAQQALFNEYYNNPRKNSAIVGYGGSQRTNDAISPFKSTYTFTDSDTPSGLLTLPANYMYLISLQTTVYSNDLARNITYPVQVLNEEELSSRLESQVCPVSTTGPICIMNSSNKIQLFPETGQSGKLFYFRRPAVPVFGYTQSGRTITYNSGTSTQLEWRDSEINNVIAIALSYFGINMRAADLIQFAELKTNEGQ